MISRKIIFWSGGLDSTACLLWALEENNKNHSPKNKVEAAYVEISNNHPKNICEQNARDNMKWLINDNIGNFELLNLGRIELNRASGGVQSDIWRLYSFCLANEYASNTDNAELTFIYGYVRGDTLKVDPYLKECKEYFSKVLTPKGHKIKINVIAPFKDKTKDDIGKFIVKKEKEYNIKLVDKLWTCESPIIEHNPNFSGYRACGTCLPCKKSLPTIKKYM